MFYQRVRKTNMWRPGSLAATVDSLDSVWRSRDDFASAPYGRICRPAPSVPCGLDHSLQNDSPNRFAVRSCIFMFESSPKACQKTKYTAHGGIFCIGTPEMILTTSGTRCVLHRGAAPSWRVSFLDPVTPEEVARRNASPFQKHFFI